MAEQVTFQDTTLATPPSGTAVAVDDCGADGVAQIIKLAVSTDGSATPIPADASGLKVKADSLPLPTGASTAALQTQPGVDIGDVTVNNAAGASAVNIQDGGNSITVDGSVTANAGTNLNTSALALEGGGNLAAIAASASVIDDWDESDRAKVNPIVGQAGVQGGAGASTALTQRVAIATDANAVSVASLPLPSGAATLAEQQTQSASLSVIDDWDESDRAKVNPIVGQAGVAAGAGAVGATVQRTTLASDDPAVVALQIMDDWDESDRAKVNLIAGQAAITGGAGAVAANTPRVTHASDDPVTVSVQLLDDAVITDDVTTFTAGTNKGLAIAAAVDDDSTDAADEGDMVLLRATKERVLRVVAQLSSGVMQSGNDAVTPKFAVIAASSSGDNTLVSGVSSKKIRVLNYVMMSNGTVNAKFQGSTVGDLTGLLYLVANTGASSGYAPTGHFETPAGEDLQLNLSGAVAVGGHLSYIEVD